jgi:hypothetical protein
MRLSAYLAAAGFLAPGFAMAAAAGPTITIACFGSDLALSSKSDINGTAQLSAEVLSLGDGRVAPNGSVVFFVDNVPVGPANGVALKPGRDPRTGQAAGLAAISLPVTGALHLAPGGHTVTARFIPAGGSGLEPSSSNAVNNLKIGGTAIAGAPTPPPAAGTAPLPPPDPANFAPPSASPPPLQTAALAAPPPLPPPDRYWVSVEENIMTISGNTAPNGLVNSFNPVALGQSVNLGPVPTSPGFIGLVAFQESLALSPTGTLFGGSPGTGIHNGQTISAGYWLDPGRSAIDAELFLFDPTSHNDFTSSGNRNVALQVRGAGGQLSSYVISQTPSTATSSTSINTTPDVFVGLFDRAITTAATGSIAVSTSTDFLSTDLKYRLRLWANDAGSLDATAGLRYADLSESMNLSTSVNGALSDAVVYQPALGLPGTPNFTNITTSLVSTSDTFSTHNRFLGPQLGLSGKYNWGQWWISGDAKIALGPMFESLRGSGSTNSTTTTSVASTTTVLLAGIPLSVGTGGPASVTTTSSSSPFGLFRAGRWGNAVLAALPSADFKIGYDLIPDVLSVTAGYSAIFLSSVARPGDQINNTHPGSLAQTGLWAQGATVGVKYRFD